MTVRATAPGKLILMGEHSVVYGEPALVAAVDRRVAVALDARSGSRLLLDLPDLGHREETSWSDVVAYAGQARERWSRFAERPGSSRFAEVRGRDPAHVVKVALGESIRALGTASLGGARLRLTSELPVGRGFGSSAAVAVAVVAATLAHGGSEPEPERIEPLALEVERRQHGLPSGVDGATVLRGGVIWAERRDRSEEVLGVRGLGEDLALVDRVRIFDTGEPTRETGAVVAAVRERVMDDPERMEAILERMGRAVDAMKTALVDRSSEAKAALEAMRRFQRGLEALGVVPDAVRQTIREVEEAGGSAKISGAGSLAREGGAGAGPLLVLHPEPERLAGIDLLNALPSFHARLGAPGLDVEWSG